MWRNAATRNLSEGAGVGPVGGRGLEGRALRQTGAVILAKTVTAELGGAQPGPTTNPFDPRAPQAAVARRAQGELALDVLHVESGMSSLGRTIMTSGTAARTYGLIPRREIYADTCNKQSVRQALSCGMCLDGRVQKK